MTGDRHAVTPTTYFLVDHGKGMPSWCLETTVDGQDMFVDLKGRRHPAGSNLLGHVVGDGAECTLRDVAPVVAELERDLARRHLLDPWSPQGWISPSGRHHGCAFFEHDHLATAYLRKSPYELERSGWVRVHADSWRMGDTRRGDGPTPRQVETLEALGFDMSDRFARRVHVEADRSAPPPRFAHAPPGAGSARDARAPDQPKGRGGGPEAALDALVARLGTDPVLAALLATDHEPVPVVGPGRWDWMISFDDVTLGGEEDALTLAGSPGLRLRALVADQVEVVSTREPGIHVDADTGRLLGPGGSSPAP